MMIARVWRKHALRPHRCEGYLPSNDPDFETKAADIIGLYLRPPQHAVVFCVDEKSAIQALDRKDPVLPLSPGRAERHGFENYRHGTLSLYAAFNTKTGEVLVRLRRDTPPPICRLPERNRSNQRRGKEIHVIATIFAHENKPVRISLKSISRFTSIHPSPTPHGSTNRALFAKIERDVIARGYLSPSKTSKENYALHPPVQQESKTVKWKYVDQAGESLLIQLLQPTSP